MAETQKVSVKNVSQLDQFGVAPGKTGEVEITKDELNRAVERGAIEVSGQKSEPETTADTGSGSPGGRK